MSDVATNTARWYVIHAYSGFENKVKAAIEEQARKRGLEDLFEQVLVPTEEVVELRRGKKVTSDRKFLPGYVLVRMQMTDEAWHLVKDTPKVTGFLGGGGKGKPVPISDSEAERMLQQVQEGIDRPRPSVIYEVGEQVRVADGPFQSMVGHVESVDEERAKLTVTVAIFGRATPLELEYNQVEKA